MTTALYDSSASKEGSRRPMTPAQAAEDKMLRGYIKQMQTVINADLEEDRVLASQQSNFQRIAFTNFQR